MSNSNKFVGPTVGASGPRHLNDAQLSRVAGFFYQAITEIHPREMTSGCALGVDTAAIEMAEEIGVPLLRLTIPIVQGPDGTRPIPSINRDLYERALRDESGRWVIEYGRPGPVPGAAFLFRDDLTVARSEILLVVPKTPAEEQRSGTWATARRARKAGCEIRFCPLDGSEPWTEPAPERLFS